MDHKIRIECSSVLNWKYYHRYSYIVQHDKKYVMICQTTGGVNIIIYDRTAATRMAVKMIN